MCCEELKIELWKGQTCLPWTRHTLLRLLRIIIYAHPSCGDMAG